MWINNQHMCIVLRFYINLKVGNLIIIFGKTFIILATNKNFYLNKYSLLDMVTVNIFRNQF